MPEIRSGGWCDQMEAWADATDGTLVNPMGEDLRNIVTGLEAEQKKAGAIPVPRRWRIKSSAPARVHRDMARWRGR